MDEFLQHLLGTSAVATGIGWIIKFLISHYFKQRTKLEETKDELDKTRVSRQAEINDRTKEIIEELRTRQRELDEAQHALTEVVNQLKTEMSAVKLSFTTLTLSVEKSNSKYDLVTEKFMEYVPSANKRIEILETNYGKIIQK